MRQIGSISINDSIFLGKSLCAKSSNQPKNKRSLLAAPDAYPIVTFTWMILYKKYPDKEKLDALKGLVVYGLTDGQNESEALGYVPLPNGVVSKAKAAVEGL